MPQFLINVHFALFNFQQKIFVTPTPHGDDLEINFKKYWNGQTLFKIAFLTKLMVKVSGCDGDYIFTLKATYNTKCEKFKCQVWLLTRQFD